MTYEVCVLTGPQTGNYEQIVRWWSLKPQSGIATVLDYTTYCYVLLPRIPFYSSTLHNYHTSPFVHLCVNRLCTCISVYRMRSFAHTYEVSHRKWISEEFTAFIYSQNYFVNINKVLYEKETSVLFS